MIARLWRYVVEFSKNETRTQSGPRADPVRTQSNAGRVSGRRRVIVCLISGGVRAGYFWGLFWAGFGGRFRGGFGVGFRGCFGGRFRAGLCRPSASQKAARRRWIGRGSGGAACSFFA